LLVETDHRAGYEYPIGAYWLHWSAQRAWERVVVADSAARAPGVAAGRLPVDWRVTERADLQYWGPVRRRKPHIGIT
jgi:hypothetical protein